MKIVLHVSNEEQINRMINNVNNLYKEDESLIINVVINGDAVTKFIEGSNLNLNNKATHFLCENSLRANKIAKENIMPETKITSSGVYKLALLQNEGFYYIKV